MANYEYVNFKECITLLFTNDFNGMNLIFLFWLALLLFHMFESFGGFGIGIKKRKFDKEKEAITSDFRMQVMKVQGLMSIINYQDKVY